MSQPVQDMRWCDSNRNDPLPNGCWTFDFNYIRMLIAKWSRRPGPQQSTALGSSSMSHGWWASKSQVELFNAGGSVKALGPKNIKCWNIVAGLIRIYDIYIIDRLDITFTVHMCLKYLKVSSSLRWSFQIVPSNSHQKSSWLCEAVFCQDRIAKRMVEEAEKTLGSAMGRQNCTGEFPHRETMADRGRPWWSGDLRSGRIKPGPGLSLLGALLGGFYFDFAASDDPKISIYQPHSARWHPHWGHQRQHWRRPVHGLCHQRPVVAS